MNSFYSSFQLYQIEKAADPNSPETAEVKRLTEDSISEIKILISEGDHLKLIEHLYSEFSAVNPLPYSFQEFHAGNVPSKFSNAEKPLQSLSLQGFLLLIFQEKEFSGNQFWSTMKRKASCFSKMDKN